MRLTKKVTQLPVPVELVESKIYFIRSQKVMRDSDLADLYHVPTKSLNLAVKRNAKRFPNDFMFRLTKKEDDSLRFQSETSKTSRVAAATCPTCLRSTVSPCFRVCWEAIARYR